MLDNHRSGTKPVSTAKASARKKGHVMPLYEALDPDSVRERTCGEARLLDEGGSLEHVCGTVGLKQPGSVGETGGQNVNRRVLPVGMWPSTVSFGLSEAALSALPFGAVPSRPEIPRVSCKTSLVVLNLSLELNFLCLVAVNGRYPLVLGRDQVDLFGVVTVH